MVAGGGASVVYRCLFIPFILKLFAKYSQEFSVNLLFVCSDTICDLGGVDELANYGEYSGAPSEQQTYDYAKTILSLMTREKHVQGEPTLR